MKARRPSQSVYDHTGVIEALHPGSDGREGLDRHRRGWDVPRGHKEEKQVAGGDSEGEAGKLRRTTEAPHPDTYGAENPDSVDPTVATDKQRGEECRTAAARGPRSTASLLAGREQDDAGVSWSASEVLPVSCAPFGGQGVDDEDPQHNTAVYELAGRER